jgi:hypothetical protein
VPCAAGGPTGVIAQSDLQAKCARLGFKPVAVTPQKFAGHIKTEVEK